MRSQNDIIKTLKQQPIEDVRKKYYESKTKLLSRDVQKLYHLTKGFNLALYDMAKEFFDENIVNNGKGLNDNQRGLNFLGYQRLIAMTL
ncbi:hypothetical protein GOQ27_14370 [Clostridium sp. D2Q-11]|uniref:Uncharacterized protein n=1 Tax=Anaeromonas frigoriresistens TaxID=2683708 RepID=A0A942V0I2_9FIRM|nr:hypothetical protein [Anaeromonas frigoriresistens]MBS4539656.1 hypothetical protein [Anaeromonas frigoriresistens]